MAKIQYSAVIGDIRGKLGGSQFSKNKSGNIFQNKPNRKQSSSSGQSAYRSNFAFLSKHWNGISVSDKEANSAAALNYPYVDKFGVTRYFSGYQLLLRSNLNRLMSGLAPIDVIQSTPPAGATLDNLTFTINSVYGTGRIFTINFDAGTSSPSDYDVQLFMGIAGGNGVMNYSGTYLFFYNTNIGSSPGNFGVSYYTPAAYWQSGQKVFVKLVVIHMASGIEVSSYIISAIVAS